MRILILGGSWFLGSAVLEEALLRGHEPTVFNRGRSRCPPAPAVHIRGDWENEQALAQLGAAGPWDAVIDVAGVIPRIVRRCAAVLASRVDRYVFVSTVSAYRRWPYAPVTEESPLWAGVSPDHDPGTRIWDPDAYGPLKVGCERAIGSEVGMDRLSIVRPHVILGPREYVGRLSWWLSRIARGGQVLVPGPPDRSIQPVDVRDAARFIVDRAESSHCGVYNIASPRGRESFGDFVESCRVSTGSEATPVWVDETWLEAEGVRQWTELPMWRALPTAWAMATDRAEAVGLRCRPLSETVADTWAWMQAGGEAIAHSRAAEHGIATDRETQLLAEWRRSYSGWQHGSD
ncbi:NAD-dependent epimerase/dehydratase family protein [Nocardia salmonicida]|nr:reductase [Nocardia sp.]